MESEDGRTVETKVLDEQTIAYNKFYAAAIACSNLTIKTNEDLDVFKEKITNFLKLYEVSAKYYEIKGIASKNIEQIKENLEKLEKLFNIHPTGENINFKEELNNLRLLISNMNLQIITVRKNCVSNLQDNSKKTLEKLKKRNESLAKQLDLYCKNGHKVFVIASASYLLKRTRTQIPQHNEAVDHLHNFLKNHKFVIYVKREVMEQQEVAKAHPKLQIFSNKQAI